MSDTIIWIVAAGIVTLTGTFCGCAGADPMAQVNPAQAFRAQGQPVVPAPDGTIFCEAEEFQIQKPGWKAAKWGENYYAATLANTFLSRKAFLGAPAQCADTLATINVDVKEAGRYLVLVRYEAAYRFETQFRVMVTQGGKTGLDRLYGARDNIKIWGFGERLRTEVAWPWGAVENVVWEGHNAYVDLKPGPAQITLLAGKQPTPAAKRNVDLVMLTTDEAQVKHRIDKEKYLPLDGWLTQAGDVWLRITNSGQKPVRVESLKFADGPMQQHSPYWVHLRNWEPIALDVPAGVALWFSETADIWHDNDHSFAAAKRALYVALLGTGHWLDFLVEEDALKGILNSYKVLYLTDRHVSTAASAKIAEWVKNGGTLFTTAGAGMFDEYNRPNRTLRDLMGVDQTELIIPSDAQIGFMKQDMPFTKSISQVTWKQSGLAFAKPAVKLDVFGLYSKVKTAADAAIQGTFADGSPAIIVRNAGRGKAVHCAFLPSLTYFKPAIPLRPVDRGATDDAMSHFIPTEFDQGARALIATAVTDMTKPIATDADLIETAALQSKAGMLIVLQNWSGKPFPGMKLTANIGLPLKDVALASGRDVIMQKQGDKTILTFDMEISGDVLILRP